MPSSLPRHPAATRHSLEAVRTASEVEIPAYAGAGVPLAVVAALNHAGVPIRFMEFAAASGWAFSFGYQYHDISQAFMAVRGQPGREGPLEVFAFLPTAFGLDYEMALTGDPEGLWAFVATQVDAGVPIMSEHLDGGLISAYRTMNGRRQIFFDGTVCPGWVDVEGLNPYAVYSFVQGGEPMQREEITRRALLRAVEKGRARKWSGAPQGLAGLQAYLADVKDPSRDFEESQEWFCWAAFERLMARRCAEVWLRSVRGGYSGEPGNLISAAAAHYGEAFRCYDGYLGETQGCDPPRPTLRDRARSPERIEACAPLLEKGVGAEARGLEALEEAVSLLE